MYSCTFRANEGIFYVFALVTFLGPSLNFAFLDLEVITIRKMYMFYILVCDGSLMI